MAAKKNTATDPNGSTPPATTTSADGSVITAAPAKKTGRPRGPNNPDTTIGWDGARDAVLVGLLLQNPGNLTTAKVVEALRSQPAFASDAQALATETAPEKIRQRVKKLNDLNEAAGRPFLKLKHKSNSGYDADAVLAAVYAQMGIQAQAQAPVAPFQAQQQTPVPAPAALPTFPTPGVLNTLIPT